MTLLDLENLTAAELKAQREDAATAVAAATVEQLRERYLKTLIDAKARDEKLAEQGKTIATLQEAFEQLQVSAGEEVRKLEGIAADLQKQLRDSQAAFRQLKDRTDAERQNHSLTVEELLRDLQTQAARGDRLKAEATRNLRALREIATEANACLADFAIEQADQSSGE